MKRVKLNMTHNIVYIQTVNLLEHLNGTYSNSSLNSTAVCEVQKVIFKIMWENLFLTTHFFFSGGGKDATAEMTYPWKETTLQTIRSNFAKTDIYNTDEFGLF